MTPSEFARMLAEVNGRLRSAWTATSSLLLLTGFALAATYGVHALQPGLGKTMAVLALGGILGLIVTVKVLRWQRDEIYDDIVLSGFRHVEPQAVSQRAAALVDRTRRRQLAHTLDSFVLAARTRQATAVPLHRGALRACEPKVREISTLLRAEAVQLDPAGMVLLRRLITDGARSPLYHVGAQPRELERALERIRCELARDEDHDMRLAA
jgi:hypothetical protein